MSCRFHPNLQTALRLSKHRPIAANCKDAIIHANIVAVYRNGKIFINLTCMLYKEKKMDPVKSHEKILARLIIVLNQ